MLHFHLGDLVPTVKHLHIGLQNPISQIDPLGPLTRSQETPPGSVFNRGLLFTVLGPPNKKKFPTLSPNTDPPNESHKPLNYQPQKKGDLPGNTKRLIRWVSGISPPGSRSRILLHVGQIFSSSHCSISDQQTVWNGCVCNDSFQIPVHERVVTMWVFLLWSSNPLPIFLSHKLRRPPLVADSNDASSLISNVEMRLKVLQGLRSKRMLSKTEFMNKRQCIIDSL